MPHPAFRNFPDPILVERKMPVELCLIAEGPVAKRGVGIVPSGVAHLRLPTAPGMGAVAGGHAHYRWHLVAAVAEYHVRKQFFAAACNGQRDFGASSVFVCALN